MMDSFDAYRGNLLELIPEPHSPEASVWVVAASDYVFEVLGADSEIGRKLSQVRYSPYVSSADGRVPVNWADQFEDARRWALGLLDTAESKTRRQQIVSPTICALHPAIESTSLSLFESGHFAEAVEAAFKEIDVRVQRLAALDDGVYGRRAMGKAFDGDRPTLMINDLVSVSDRNEQEGFALIFKGAMQGIRNPKAHANIELENADRAMNYLGLASLLMRRLDDTEAGLG